MIGFVLYLVAAAAPAAQGETLAHVDDRAIAASTFKARLASMPGAAPEAVLQDLVNDTLLAVEAERLGLGSDPAVIAEVEAARRKLAAQRLVETELDTAAAHVDDALLRELYHSKADVVHLEAITLAGEAEAKACVARLQKGARFAEEAKQSLDPRGRDAGGDMGTLARDELDPELAKAAFAAPPKTLGGPVKLSLGWAVFQVLERELGDEKGFAAKRSALEAWAKQTIRLQARNHYLDQLRKEAGAQVDVKWVESLGPRLDATPEERAHVLARVWGKPLLYGEVLPDIEGLSRGITGGHMSGPRVKLEVIYQRVNDLLLEEAAVRRKHDKAPELAAQLEPRRMDALTRAYALKLRAQVPPPTAAEIEAEYHASAARFTRPGHRTCSQVLVQAKGMGELVRKRIAGGEKLEDVARTESVDPAGAKAGGLIGDVYDDRLEALSAAGAEPELAKAIRTARAGELVGPVKSKMGWHVLRCDAYQAPTLVPVAEVTPAIRAELLRRRGDDAIRRRISELRARARVSLDEQAIARATAPAK